MKIPALALVSALAVPLAAVAADNDLPSLWAEFPLRRDEPALFTRPSPGSPPEATLLFAPRKLVRVRASDPALNLHPGDFRIEGRKIIHTGPVAIPALDETGLFPVKKTSRSIGRHLDGVRNLLFSEGRYFHDLQLRIDYETDERWTAPVFPPPPTPARISRLSRLIAEGRPITVVLLGDSISTGANAVDSPGYVDRFIERLRARAAGEVTLHNLSKGGMSTPWGVGQAARAAALRPDLFIVAFGMNDASGVYPPENYAGNIRRMIETVTNASPGAECALVSGMNANPAWHLSRPDLHAAYHEQLRALAAPGVTLCDVFTPWNRIVSRKGFPSLTGNGVNHPNDFGHRLYADILAAGLLD